MDFWNSLGILARRWYIVVGGLALTAVVAVALGTSITPTYRASGTVVFYGPGKLALADADPPAADAVRSNPFLGFDGSVGVTSEIVARTVIAPTSVRSITGGSPGRSFDVQPDINARGPILQLNADGPTASAAVQTLDRGIAAMNKVLEQQQGAVGAPKDQFVRLAVLRADRTAAPLSGNRVKAVIAVSVLGCALTIALAFAVDAVARTRRRSDEDPVRAFPADRSATLETTMREPTRAS